MCDIKGLSLSIIAKLKDSDIEIWLYTILCKLKHMGLNQPPLGKHCLLTQGMNVLEILLLGKYGSHAKFQRTCASYVKS